MSERTQNRSVVPSYVRPAPSSVAGLPHWGWTAAVLITVLIVVDVIARLFA